MCAITRRIMIIIRHHKFSVTLFNTEFNSVSAKSKLTKLIKLGNKRGREIDFIDKVDNSTRSVGIE